MRHTWLAAVVVLAGLAGCVGDGDTDGAGPSDSDIPAGMVRPSNDAPDGVPGLEPTLRAADVFRYGQPDGHVTSNSSPPAFARAVRGFDPDGAEPRLVAAGPDDHEPGPDDVGVFDPGPGPDPPFDPAPQLETPTLECERAPIHPDQFQAFDDIVADYMAGAFSAATLAVSDRCGTFYEQGYGIMGPRPWAASWVDPADDFGGYLQHVFEPVPPDALFKIASTTKPVTSSVIWRMIGQGLIDLDDKVFCQSSISDDNFWMTGDQKCLLHYDPAGSVPNGPDDTTVWLGKQLLDVQDLLEHKVGWNRDPPGSGDFTYMPATVAAATGGLPVDIHDFVRFALAQPSDWVPGTNPPNSSWDQYSNLGFSLLGLIIEEWGSKSFLQYLRDDLFGHWGVPASDVHAGRSVPANFHAREVYYPCGGTRSAIYPGDTPDLVCMMYGGIVDDLKLYSGFLLTTAGALAEWMSHFWVDSAYDVNKGVPRRYADYMTFPDGQIGTHTGSLGGVKTFLVQCLDGLNYAFLSNSAADSTVFDRTAMRDDLCGAKPAFDNAGPEAVLHAFNVASDWTYLHGLPSVAHEAAAEDLVGDGYRVEDVDCHVAGDELRYGSSYSKDSGPSWSAQSGLTTAQLQTEMEQRLADGFMPARFAACRFGADVRWIVLWHHVPGADWVANPGLQESEFIALVGQRAQQGYHPIDLAVYVSGQPLYAAIWLRPEGGGRATAVGGQGGDWQLHVDLPRQGFQDLFLDLYHDDVDVVSADVVRVGTEYRYSGIWSTDARDVTYVDAGVMYGQLPQRYETLVAQYDRGAFIAVA